MATSLTMKIVMENPNSPNEPNEAIPEVNPVIPEPNHVEDAHDPNEMVDIPDDEEWKRIFRKGRKTKPKTTKLGTEWKSVKRRSQIEAKKSNSQSQSQPRQSQSQEEVKIRRNIT
ncbi:hypothetical protein Tco_0542654 [Tanacetum coccineum]